VVIPSSYRVSFVVVVTRLTGELLTHVRHSEVLQVLPFNIDVGQTCGPLTTQKSDRHDRMAG
jgi:hypothetical protein